MTLAVAGWLETAGTVAAVSAAVIGWVGLIAGAIMFAGLGQSQRMAVDANAELRAQVLDLDTKLSAQEHDCNERIVEAEAKGREQAAHLQGQLDAVSSRIVGELVDRVGKAVEDAVESATEKVIARISSEP